jgi:hypothetical protein
VHLAGAEGVSVTLRPVGYEFPDASAGEWHDQNWLLIDVAVNSLEGAWAFRDPCMLTSEAVELGAWLARAGQGVPTPSGPDADGNVWPEPMFIEPSVGFAVESYDADAVVLRIHFSLESAPAWAGEEQHTVTGQFYVRCRVRFADVVAASQAWLAEVAEFPERGSRSAGHALRPPDT